MSNSQVVNLLRRMHFLRDLELDTLISLAAELERIDFEPDHKIFQQGAPPDAFFFVLQGEVLIERRLPEAPPIEIALLETGDTFGEMEMFFPAPRYAAAIAVGATTVLRWDRMAMARFLDEHPAVLDSLRFIADSHRLARQTQFPWLSDDEVLHGLAHKHPIILLQWLIPPVLICALALSVLWFGWIGGLPALAWLGAGLLVLGLGLIIWRWIDWGNDYYLVTDQRAVWIERVVALYDSRQEAPLHMVLSVSVSTDVLGRTFGYGDVIIRTFTGQVTFRNMGNPRAMAAVIEEHWRRVQGKQERLDRKTLVEAMRNRLEPPEVEFEPVPKMVRDETLPKPRQKSQTPVGLDHWTLEVRFEDRGVITYRKHWAVLLKLIAAPSIALLLLVGALGARLAGLIDLFRVLDFILITLFFLIPLGAWWVYQYADWANDLYQITPDQIIDTYKKPLAREERKVAPLDNILGTEVVRRGLIGLLLNYGKVIAEVGTTKFDFEGVFNPVAVQQDIVRAQEAFMQRKQRSDRQRRLNEMVEWFSIYHQDIAPKGIGNQQEGET